MWKTIQSIFAGVKDLRGVRTFDSDMPLLLRRIYGVGCIFLGLVDLGFAVRSDVQWYLKYHTWFGPAMLNIGLGGGFTLYGMWLLYLCYHLSRLTPTERICAQFGVD